MLKDAGRVGHVQQVIEPQLGQIERSLVERRHDVPPARLIDQVAPRLLERFHVEVCDVAPDHFAAQHVGPLPHRVAARLVGQQPTDLASKRRGVGERHQHAAAVGEQLFGVPIRRRDHRFAAAERIGQRAGGDLCLVQIRRDVQVGRADELRQLAQLDEAVVEDDMLRDAQIAGQSLQAQPIGFALGSHEIRVRCPQHHVDEIGKLLEHGRHRPQCVLDSLVRREQAKRQRDLLPFDAKLAFEGLGIDERHVGNAVGDQRNLAFRNAVDRLQQRAAPFGHHDQPGRHLRELFDDPPLLGIGLDSAPCAAW